MSEVKAIVSDFSRVLLFPVDDAYIEGLNSLNARLLQENPSYNFFDYFRLNDELLAFYRNLNKKGIPVFIFTSDVVQDHPAIKTMLAESVSGVISAKTIGMSKKSPETYSRVAEMVGFRPEELLFIDDIEANIQAAKQASYRTLLFNGTKSTIESAVKQIIDL